MSAVGTAQILDDGEKETCYPDTDQNGYEVLANVNGSSFLARLETNLNYEMSAFVASQ